MQAVPLRLAGGPFNGRLSRLGLPPETALPVSISATDAKGDPFEGALAEIDWPDGRTFSGMTGPDGLAIIVLPGRVAQDLEVRVATGPYLSRRDVPAAVFRAGETLFFQFPVDRPEPLFKAVEIGALIAGAALAGAGFYYDQEALKITGEILIGAGAFTAIYRHTC